MILFFVMRRKRGISFRAMAVVNRVPPPEAGRPARIPPLARERGVHYPELDYCPFRMPSGGCSHQQRGTPCW
jgi:hypothetical protein